MAQQKKYAAARVPSKCWCRSAIAWLLLVQSPAQAHGMPFYETAISVGPQLSYNFASEGRKAAGYGVDFAFVYTPLWGGGGFKLSHGADDVIVSPYLEAGFWFLLNVGFGYAPSFQSGETYQNVHLFLGAPVPLNWVADDLSGEEWLLMGEPYYRRTWRLESDFRENEIGILVKFVFDL